MRKPKMEWSDEFDFDEADLTIPDDYDPINLNADDHQPENHPRALSAWQEIEDRIGKRSLQAELSDWDYWDELLEVH